MTSQSAIFVCVWDADTDELLFECSSAALPIETVRDVVGPDAFPADPELMTGHPVSAAAGRRLIGLMGHRYDGEGEFQVSREYVRNPGATASAAAAPATIAPLSRPAPTAGSAPVHLAWTLAPFALALSLTIGLASLTHMWSYGWPMTLAVAFTAVIFGMRHAVLLTALNTISFNLFMVDPVFGLTRPSCSEWSRFLVSLALAVGIPFAIRNLPAIRDWIARAEIVLRERLHSRAPQTRKRSVR